MKTLLSIDFDFFIRENPLWDFGHSETNSIFLDIVWPIRYSSVDLYRETDIIKYADFPPIRMKREFKRLGFDLRNAKVRIADSHRHAYFEARELGKCRIFNFDAHHDCWRDKNAIDCGNWLYRAIQDKYINDALWILPTWLKKFGTVKMKHIHNICFKDLSDGYFKSIKIDTIFICRSGCWTPPHHDIEFLKMVATLNKRGNDFKIIEDINYRKFPTEKDAKALFKANKKILKKLRIPKSSIPICGE